MKTHIGTAAAIAAILATMLAAAAPPPTVVEVRTVTGTHGLQSADFGGMYLVIDDYATVGDGGGGYFAPVSNARCASNTGNIPNQGDGGVTLLDGASHCFMRRFTGAVHMKWYGETNDASTQLTNAMAAALAYGNGCVDLDGLRVHIGSAANPFGVIAVPPNVVIGCDDAALSGSPDYSSSPNALLLYESAQTFVRPPATTLTAFIGTDTIGNISVSSTVGWSTTDPSPSYAWIDNNEIVAYDPAGTTTNQIDLLSRNRLGTSTAAHNANAVITNVPRNWTIQLEGNDGIENVSILPQWADGLSANDVGGPPTNDTLRHWLDEVLGRFYGEALRCVNNGCNIENVNILGFDVGIEAVGASRLYIHHVNVDANNCFWLHGIGAQTQGGDLRCFPALTTGSNNDKQWNVTAMANDSGAIKLTLAGGDSDPSNWFRNGDTIWISKAKYPQGANGRWTVANASVNTANGTATLDLAGSSYGGPSTTGTLTLGSATMRAVGSLANVYGQQRTMQGQSICASGTAPFCTAPAGIAGGIASVSNAPTINSLAKLGAGAIAVASTANWPASGFVKIDSEAMSYTLVDSHTIRINARAQEGTAAAKHANGAAVTPSVATVVTTWPAISAVVMSDPATASANGVSIAFLNDNSAKSNNAIASVYASERYWTYNQAAGPWNGNGPLSLPLCAQPQPASADGAQISSPGNCPATGFLIGGHDALNDDTNGITFFNTFSYAHEDQYHIWNADSTGLYDAGSDNHGELNDANVIGYWFDGDTNRSKIEMRETHSAFIDVLQNSTTGDCNTVVAGQMDVDVANAHPFENDLGCLLLSHAVNSNSGIGLAANASSQTILGLDRMPNTMLYGEGNIAAGNTLADSSDVFANGNFAAWCNPLYGAGAAGCVRQQMLAGGTFALKSPTASAVWEYNAPTNLIFQSAQANITAMPYASVHDVTANINVVTNSGAGVTGVQLPLTTAVSDLNAGSGASTCIEVVNSQLTEITIWDHNPETITTGLTPVLGSTGVKLAAHKTGVFCPVVGTGWVGN